MKTFISSKQLFSFLGIVALSYGIIIGLVISVILQQI